MGQITLGMHVLRADGTYGVVTGWKVVPGTRVMYNLEVEQDHTFTVGMGQWVVHNSCTGGDGGADSSSNTSVQGTTDPTDRLNEVAPTLERIDSGEKFPHRNDGSIFQNREGLLPAQPYGYYREYVVPTTGIAGPGPRRLVLGSGGEIYYTEDHYRTFELLTNGND